MGESGFTAAFVALTLVWAGVAVYVLVSRALYDFRRFAFIGARRLAGTSSRLPRRTLAGIASDAHTHPAIAAEAARALLDYRWPRLLRRASAHRNEAEKWTRVAALRIFVSADWAISWPLLEDALRDPDDDVVAAAIALLGERPEQRASKMLVAALVDGRHARSRVATYLDGREIGGLLLPLVDSRDEELRYWAASLLRPDNPEAELALASLAGDPSANVRAAVAKSFAAVGGARAVVAAMALLGDHVWFVRAQAARTLAAAERPDLSHRLAPLLRDDEWWVRAAAKEALYDLGRPVVPLLTRMLHDPDRFARNGAAEVLFQLGVLDDWLEDPERTDDVAVLLHAGETPVRQASLAKMS